MKIKQIGLSWIVTKDFSKAKSFFVDTLGLKIEELNEEYCWMELAGHDGGSILGVGMASNNPEIPDPIKPGQNAVFTMIVENIDADRKELLAKGVRAIGDIIEIPGHVKMATFLDEDGNHFQLAERLD